MPVASGCPKNTSSLMKMVPLANGCTEKAEDFGACFASVFKTTDRPGACQSFQLEEHSCSNSDLPFVDTGIVRGQLQQLFLSPQSLGEFHPRVLKERKVKEEEKRKEDNSFTRDLEQSSSATAGL